MGVISDSHLAEWESTFGKESAPNEMTVDKIQLAATTRLFSPAVFHEMARKGRSPIFARLINEIGTEKFECTTKVSDVFNARFKSIDVPGYRDEYVYKSAITKNILLGRHSLNTASMLTEVRVDGNKADIVVLNGTSTVYEIKSERDSLVRLPQQLESYRRAFASVNVITSEVHAKRVIEIAPADTGVLILNRRGSISEIRKAQSNAERIDPVTLFGVLRINEAIDALEQIGVFVPKVANTQRFSVVRNLFLSQEPSAIHSACLAVLRRSRTQSGLKEFLSKLPFSLQAAGISISIKKGDQSRLLQAIDTPFIEAKNWT
jgi:hypothetical protein